MAISTQHVTRSGLRTASSVATIPPIEVPTSRHGPRSSASISPTVSATMSASEYSPGGASDGGTPLLSNVTVSYPARFSAGTWYIVHTLPPAPEPMIMSTSSP